MSDVTIVLEMIRFAGIAAIWFFISMPLEAAKVQSVKGYLAQLVLSKSEREMGLRAGNTIIVSNELSQEYYCRINQVRDDGRIQIDCDKSFDESVNSFVKIRRLWMGGAKNLPPYYFLVGTQYSYGQFQFSTFTGNTTVVLNGITLPSLRAATRFGTNFFFGGELSLGNFQESSTSSQINQTLTSIYIEYPLLSFRLGLKYFLMANWMGISGVKSGNGFGFMGTLDISRQFYMLFDYHLLNLSFYQQVNVLNMGLGYQF